MHHRNSPSALARRIACPASSRLEAISPPSEGGEDAHEGTRLHEAVAAALRGGVSTEPAVDECLAYAHSTGNMDEARVYVEELVSVHAEDGAELTRGTADLILAWPGSIHVVDWKFGRGEVAKAGDNPQLLAYVLGAEEFLRAEALPITAHVMQPLLGKCSSYTYSPAERPALRQALADALAACEDPRAQCAIGKHCKYCRAMLLCPAQRAELAIVAEHLQPEPACLDDAQIDRFLTLLPNFERLAHEVEEEARKRIRAGGLTTWTEVAGRESKRIEDAGAAYAALADIVSAEAFASACKVSLPCLAEVYSNSTGSTMRDARKTVEARLAGLVSVSAGAPKLIRRK